MADKRKIDRREFTYYMQVTDDITNQLIGYLTDISTGGFKLDSPKEIPPGHDFRMHIDLTADIADKNSMVFIARSKWCRRVPHRSKHIQHRLRDHKHGPQ